MKILFLLLAFLTFSARADELIQDTIIRLFNPYVQAKGLSKIVITRDPDPDSAYIGGVIIENNELQISFGQKFEANYNKLNQDGFAAIVCHEIGHFLAGATPPYNLTHPWSATEAKSDYFSTAVCLRKVFRELGSLPVSNVQPIVKKNCDQEFESESERNVCYRSAEAGLHLMEQHSIKLSFLGGVGNPFYRRYDLSKKETNYYTGHPSLQCRAETVAAGAWCNSAEEKWEAGNNSWPCQTGVAAKPTCCFKDEAKKRLGF